LRGGGQSNSVLLSPAGLSRAYASSPLMSSGKAQNSYIALPALDAPVGFIQDFEDVISSDFSESLKSYIAPRNLEITLSETNNLSTLRPEGRSLLRIDPERAFVHALKAGLGAVVGSTVIADIAISAIS